ncbi:hypothetical protein SLS53_001389 [Cytospora paraplurivora]|uniref:Bromo domain-containing protein n=1 Tax=Cytospora paraplurivora TaxID=2898453 RepID=A0AAN9UKD6_9PEZI
MVNAASYTPLESLLLLTWIRSHGLDAFEATAFPKLSHDLINHDSVKQDPTYDASRLNPDSLQELFLHILQEELKDEPVVQHDVAPGDASLSPNSRKRKRLSLAAHIKTLHEARQHAHRLPDAEAKLYMRYKERAVREIWERDQELRKLEEEIRQLEQQERQAIEASDQRKSVSAAPSAAASPVEEACRPPSAVQTVDAQRPIQQPNGTTGQPPLPPTPIQTAVPSNAGLLPPRQISPMRPVGTPTAPQPRVQSPVVPSGPFTQGGVGAQGSPKLRNPPTPVLQPPQGFPPLSPHPGQTALSVTQPTSDVLQRPDSASKPRPPSQHAPQTQVPPVGTSSPGNRRPHPILPHIPTTKALAFHGPLGSGTRWKATQPTPSTPGPSVGELASPAFEPLSPVLQSVSLPASSAQPSPTRPPKPTDVDASGAKKLARRPRSTQRGLDAREGSRQRRTSSVASARAANVETDPDTATKVKREEATPRPLEEAGDTTADESVSGRHHPHSPRAARSAGKRKRQDSTTSDHWAAPEHRPRVPPPPPGIPTHVLWTRGFPRVSVSTLDQISGHKHANMFSHPIRERDAPGYKTIVLGPTDLKSIRAAITAGNKAAATAAAALPEGDPGTSSVWLPISEELVPPRGIINSSHLERELVHMFSNAIMYNLDPCRGPGPAFMKGSGRGGKGANETHAHGGHGGGADPGFIGYAVDENSVVNDTQAMFAEVDKLLMELRSTEAQSGPVPLPPGAVPASERLARVAPTAVALSVETPASNAGGGGDGGDEDGDEHHTDRETEGASGTVKRRRIGRG